jgi:tetratricopeptide (TPR) repeat protein
MMRISVLLAILCVAVPAAADPASDQAAAGKKAFAEGKYAEAIKAFREANKLAPDPKLLYAIAQAQRMAGDCAAAIVTYEEFIRSKADPKLVEYSQANITRCKELLAQQPPKTDPPKVDPPKVDPPKVDPPKVDPPKADPPKADPPKPRGPERRSWTGDWVGHGLVIAGVGAAVVGTLVWTGGRSDAAALNDAPDHESFLEAQDAAKSALGRQRIGIAVGIAGVGALVGGVLHYRMSTRKEVRIGAAPAVGGGSITARVTF